METREKNSTEQKEVGAEKRVFVEVGTGSMPVSAFGKREFGENEVYLGLDINNELVSDAKGAVETVKGRRSNVFFVEATASKLPLGDESTNEIYFGNVFGHPVIFNSKDYLFVLLGEANRVLKIGGELIVLETNTPANLKSFELRINLFGFRVRKLVKSDSHDWQEEVSKYNWTATGYPAEGSYLLIAEKVSKAEPPRK